MLLYKEEYSMGIFPGAMAWINFTGACIMQNKQAFTSTQAAQRLGITQKNGGPDIWRHHWYDTNLQISGQGHKPGQAAWKALWHLSESEKSPSEGEEFKNNYKV